MRPYVTTPLLVRGREFGGSKPLFCVPLVAKDLDQLLAQAHVAHGLEPDVVEWRADSFDELSAENVAETARHLRLVLDCEPILFTLRIGAEGGKREISQDARAQCIDAILRSELIDLGSNTGTREPDT